MTTTVIVHASCAPETEVKIIELDGGEPTGTNVIQNGEQHSVTVYDEREVRIKERQKDTGA